MSFKRNTFLGLGLPGRSCIIGVSFRDDYAVSSVLVRGRDVYFARLAIPSRARLMALGCTHSALFQRKRRSLRLGNSTVAAITRPPPTLRPAVDRPRRKTFKDCKSRCGAETWICIRNMAERRLLWVAGEPPQYTALVDCRRRCEVREAGGREPWTPD